MEDEPYNSAIVYRGPTHFYENMYDRILILAEKSKKLFWVGVFSHGSVALQETRIFFSMALVTPVPVVAQRGNHNAT